MDGIVLMDHKRLRRDRNDIMIRRNGKMICLALAAHLERKPTTARLASSFL